MRQRRENKSELNKLKDMQKISYGFCLLMFALSMQMGTATAQTYKVGDRLEARIGNDWKEVVVVKAVTGKPGLYEVKAANTNNNRGASLTTQTVSKANLRTIKTNLIAAPVAIPSASAAAPAGAEAGLHLGRYELYSGIPTMYIGHIILLSGGKYKVAFSTDEDNYEIGSYTYHADTNTIEWITGMFQHNNWGGKMVSHNGGYRIEFNKASYADSN